MAAFLKGRRNYPGPWLLDRSALEELDQIVERLCSTLHAEATKRIEQDVAEEEERLRTQIEDNAENRKRAAAAHAEAIAHFRAAMADATDVALSELPSEDSSDDRREKYREIERERQREIEWERQQAEKIEQQSRAEQEAEVPKTLAAIREKSRQRYFVRRRVSLALRGGRQIDSGSFAQARTELAAEQQLAEKFELEIQTGLGVSCTMTLEREYSEKIEIKVSPDRSPLAAQMLHELCDWAERHRPSVWLRAWTELRFLGFFLFLIPITGWMVAHNKTQPLSEGRVRELLADGLQPSEYGEALELLLKMQFGLEPKTSAPATWLPGLLITSTIAALALIFPPDSVIGLDARGERAVKLRRGWIWLVTIGVPTTLLLNPLFDLVKGMIWGK